MFENLVNYEITQAGVFCEDDFILFENLVNYEITQAND